MEVREIRCKSLLNKSKLSDYCINCYVGCQHSCTYCYAEYYTKKYTKHKEGWGSFVDAKINAPEVLRKEILKKKKGSVFLSSLTDPYQPLEKKYELTRKCLEILLRNNFSVWVQTKSSLILRDLDIMKKFKERCEVCFTITSLNENFRKVFEPNSSSVEEKLDAIKILKENGIKVSVFFGPVLPFISDENLEEYFEVVKELGVDEVWVDKLNLKPGIWERIEKVLDERYPELKEKWRKIFFERNDYYKKLKEKIRETANKKNLKIIFCY
ncbi:MAG: SPL family radical SAM protein [Candidatus Aenigmatarchaeota archaeon]